MSIASCLKKLRAEKEWTQGDVCRATGFERSYVSKLESGRAKDLGVRSAMKLAHAFGLMTEEFWTMCQAEDGGDSRDKSESSAMRREE